MKDSSDQNQPAIFARLYFYRTRILVLLSSLNLFIPLGQSIFLQMVTEWSEYTQTYFAWQAEGGDSGIRSGHPPFDKSAVSETQEAMSYLQEINPI
jgi:hypothetical protein